MGSDMTLSKLGDRWAFILFRTATKQLSLDTVQEKIWWQKERWLSVTTLCFYSASTKKLANFFCFLLKVVTDYEDGKRQTQSRVEETRSQLTMVRVRDETFFQRINQSVKTGHNSEKRRKS